VADRVVLNLEIDAAGKFKSCKVGERLGLPDVGDPCIAATREFPPRKGPNGKAAPFSATESFTTLLLVDPRRLPLSGSLQGLISSEDYPAEALDRNEQGTVGIRLHVNAAGEVSECVIEKSSGFAILDKTTCDLVRRRAKFEPARDREGGPVASETRSQISWQIAEDRASSEPWVSRIIIRFGPNGRLASCRIELEGSLRRMAGPTVPECPADALKGFPRDLAEFRGSIATIVSEESFAMGHVSAPPVPAGDTLIGRAVTTVNVDADGKLTSCKVAQVDGEELQDDPCAEIEKLYEPRRGADGKPVPFDATKIITLYAHQEKVALGDRFQSAIPR
jgi:TonB family protein